MAAHRIDSSAIGQKDSRPTALPEEAATQGTNAWDDVRGLSVQEVAERVATGRTNRAGVPASRSPWDILVRNTFTWLNFLLVALAGLSWLSPGMG